MLTRREHICGAANCHGLPSPQKPRLVVLTGGPCGGKTAILELAQKIFCNHVAFVPEAATITYGGGFWRIPEARGIKAAQRVICCIQKELEGLVQTAPDCVMGVCDRGIIDTIGYWPDSELNFWQDIGRTRQEIYEHYAMVIHLKTPTTAKLGYNFNNPVRNESMEQAVQLDEKIQAVWEGHPNRVVVEPTEDFMDKATQVFELLSLQLPDCCQTATKI